MDADVLVVGAGPAGLALAACLRRRGVPALVLDRRARVGDSWREHYDRLHLHTPRMQSGLPGMTIPRRCGRWVARDDVVEYLTAYAGHHGIEPRFGVEVQHLAREDGGWAVHTSRGSLRARQVVVATGRNRVPLLPAWPGRDSWTRPLLHASTYRNPAPHRGADVLVVGAGNSGAEIAADLAEGGAARVRLAVRTPPNVVPRQLGPLPTTLLGVPQDALPAGLVDPLNRVLQRWSLGDLTQYGLPAPRAGVVAQARATGTVPTIDVGLVEQLRTGRIRIVAALSHLEADGVVLVDGSRIHPDAVIAATGWSPGLVPLVGHLGVLDAQGLPLVHGSEVHPGAPDLRFLGLRNPLKGALLQIRLDARATAAALAREVLREPSRR